MTTTRPARPLAGFVIMVALALLVYGLSFMPKPDVSIIPDYKTVLSGAGEGKIGAKLAWMFGDWGDPAFQKTEIGGILMILGAFLAHVLAKKKKTTFGICYGSGLFLPVLAAQILAALISNFLYQNLFKIPDVGFVPTFIPIVSITPAVVLLYGGRWYKVLTAAVIGGLIGCPFAYFIFVNFAAPYGFPGAVAWVTPMIIGGLLAGEICKYLPWMTRQASDPAPAPAAAAPAPAEPPKMNTGWFIKRVFADFSEANFYGSEIAGVFFIIGGIVAVYLNPLYPGYGDGNTYLVILASQILASAFGIFIYWHRYFELGWYPTFIPVVTMGPIFVLFYGTSLHVVITGALIGALFMPPFGNWVSRGLPSHQLNYVGSVASMLVNCIVMVAIFNYVPGFGV